MFARRAVGQTSFVMTRSDTSVTLSSLFRLERARLLAVLTAKPDRTASEQVADHDPIIVTFADRDLIDADDLRPRGWRAGKLGAHVLLVQLFDRLPVQMKLLGDVLDRRRATAPTHVSRAKRLV